LLLRYLLGALNAMCYDASKALLNDEGDCLEHMLRMSTLTDVCHLLEDLRGAGADGFYRRLGPQLEREKLGDS
jgi:hypothetical protein